MQHDKEIKHNILNKNIINIILINIISFLPIKNIYLSRIVCKEWRDILTGNLAKNMIAIKVPVKITHLETRCVDFSIDYLLNINNQFFVSGYNDHSGPIIYNFNTGKYINTQTFLKKSNSKYICGSNINIEIFNPLFEKLYSWKCLDGLIDLAIDEDYIYIINLNLCRIFDFKGKLINKWDIPDDEQTFGTKININKDKIYLTTNDYRTNWLQIFSQKGESIRKIKISENSEEKKYFDVNFTIFSNIIYLYDFVNNVIKFFSCNGDLINKYPLIIPFEDETYKNIRDILVIDDHLYISHSIYYLNVFKLQYS